LYPISNSFFCEEVQKMTTENANLQTVENCNLQTQVCEAPADNMNGNRPVLVPKADIFETAANIVVLTDLPGVDQSSVDITVEKNILTIKGSSQLEVPAGMSLSYAEFKVGDYQRRFALPNEVDKDGIAASMKNGVLKLVLPKSAGAKLRKITVTSES
jgi:HSP20 family protein